MTKKQKAEVLHLKALKLAETYRRQEVMIIQVLQEIDNEKAFYFYNCKSLFEYATTQLKLTESVAYAFITVSRKSKEVPELQEKINSGKISVHKAKKICSVLQATKPKITTSTANMISLNELAQQKSEPELKTKSHSALENIQENRNTNANTDSISNTNHSNKHVEPADEILSIKKNQAWLEMAENLSTRKLEEKVAEQNPETYQRKEFRKSIGQNMESLTLRLSKEQVAKLERVKELLSTQKGKEVQLLDCLNEMLDLYIEKKDPVKKAERAKNKSIKRKAIICSEFKPNAHRKLKTNKSTSGTKITKAKQFKTLGMTSTKNQREPISSGLRHELYLRNGGQCCHRDKEGNRCQSRKWLHLHHKHPVSQGGKNELNNLELICSAHHRQHHFIEEGLLKKKTAGHVNRNFNK